ncbi:MAG TPA: peptide-methionine (R)-S-oxide reductase [Sphingobium sp.]|jgi:peptide-methionine (R)-S-oxide reductase|uniref:peptide-methionine (R)-S-oxide reductase MsrB n=1 Tax=unclassified Sphingobium TaxID=2611147 RepID=UPI0007F40603|nr:MULTISPECIES: peptide-methionine (R)-S-oxide reductase MsrB [unclassified Sphingobium]OAN51940.1 peptide-methionine (R)-S-oxide reductase [Sphingobium sp. TCM1]WIW88346.1 peptide-methionine (R)-S-oxide reductase MsrB [Sphingobium sp. V4]HAF41269.1 peptide-methionine (R)-S-oxide reductase [Sphingobium sp.]
MNRRHFLGGVATGAAALALWRFGPAQAEPAYPYRLTDAEWRRKLSPWAYKVLRQEATEYPGSSPLNKEHRAGIFSCAGCGQRLFSSRTKFDSGTGWPSFWAALPKAVGTSRDFALGYPRTEVHCARCGGHLGHVFDDGPRPTGKRYCMNGVALAFSPS